jgi:hypothetical protein
MSQLISIFALILFGPIAAAYAQQTIPASGEAVCQEMVGPSGCKITWTFLEGPRPFYRVQRFSTDSHGWENTGKPYIAADGVSKAHKAGGLYRVTACDDRDAKTNCRYSTVLWMPIMLDASALPETVVIHYLDDDGVETANVRRESPNHLGLLQYNVYTMINTAYEIGLDLPKMSAHSHPNDPAKSTTEHAIQDKVYLQYKDLRERYGSKLSATNAE